MRYLLLLFALSLFSALGAQNIPTLKFIEGGTHIHGGGYQFAVKDYYLVLLGNDSTYTAMNADQTVIGEIPGFNNPERRVTCASFYMSETEITNAQYRYFLLDSLLNSEERKGLETKLKAAKKASAETKRAAWQPLIQKAGAVGLLPDSMCWARDFVFGYNDPLVKNYFWHDAFSAYPVVGVTWDQANAYCQWLTEYENRERAKQGKPLQPAYRLPTEAEWEYAAKARTLETETTTGVRRLYPWSGRSVLDEKGRFRANIKTDHGDYIGDNYEYTAPVKSFTANEFGLYDMAGNVSEWCLDVMRFNSRESLSDLDFQGIRNPAGRQVGPQLFQSGPENVETTEQRVVKGGSWADYKYAAMSGSRMGHGQNQSGSRIGFRVAMIKMGSPTPAEF